MSSNEIAIKVENISKLYRIGVKQKMHDSFASTIFDFIKSPLTNYRKYRSLYEFDDIGLEDNYGYNSNSSDIIWALKKISFDVKQGEVFGIIGGNGAGKSTLLKILCKITDPTTGHAEIRGRVSSLLEVGTGFHPELTGRENVYLNGTILGMRKYEIVNKFDEIVDFSGVGKFIDTPVKRYSSGMAVRLAFSVAAHLEPEILLVDEVLAVGDAAFQKKCLRKMSGVAQQGRTILFVSHNMGAISYLCERALWLDQGQFRCIGSAAEIVSSYLFEKSQQLCSTWYNNEEPKPDMEASIRSVRLLTENNEPTATLDFGQPYAIEITYDVLKPVSDLSVTYHLFNSEGVLIYESMDTDMLQLKGVVREPGKYVAICRVEDSLLKPGRYQLSMVSFIERIKIIERQKEVLSFDVCEKGYFLNPGRLGVISPVYKWDVTRIDKIGNPTVIGRTSNSQARVA